MAENLANTKIGFYSRPSSMGGSEVYLRELLKNIDSDRYDVTVYGNAAHPLREDQDIIKRVEAGHICWCIVDNVISETKSDKFSSDIDQAKTDTSITTKEQRSLLQKMWRVCLPHNLKLFFGTLKEIIRIKKIFQKNPVDIIHFNDTGCEPATIAARLAGVSVITGTLHVLPSYDQTKTDWVHRWIEYVSMRSLTNIISVSEATKQDWLQRTRIKDRISVIYNGIKLENFPGTRNPSDFRKELGLSESNLIIVTPARFHRMKGHRFLVEAAQDIIKEYPEVKIVWPGTGPLENELKTQVKEAGLESYFIFLGHRTDMPDVLNLADLVVLPSIELEALPFALIEASACKKPIVSTWLSGIPEVVENGVTGLLVPVKDVQALVAAVNELLANMEKQRSMGEAGRLRAEKLFTEDKMLRETFDFWDKVLSKV